MFKRIAWTACIVGIAGAANAQSLLDPGLQYRVLPVSGLAQPTGMRFIDGDSLFVIEKATGKVRLVDQGNITDVLDLAVNSDSERGLIGIELDPNFASNGYTYLQYSRAAADGGAWIENRVSRFTWNGSALVNEMPILSIPTDPSQSNGPNHNGGPLLFGPDGKLYGATGDLNRSRAEQNNQAAPSSSHTGGLFRINPDGSIPADNPFVSNANADFHQWFAYGVRNSFGLAFDPATNRLWDTENGPSSYDEINLVAAGFNSGWNQIMGPDSRDPQNQSILVNLPGSAYSDPEFSFLTPIGVTSLQFLYGSALGAAFDDALIVGDNNTQNLYLLRLNAARDGFVLSGGLTDLVADTTAERNQLLFGQDFGVVTDLQIGPNGNLYVLSLSDGAIFEISAVPEAGPLAMAGLGLTGLWAATWRRRRRG
jgi:glucose/arabinose dehydrogenase